MPLMLSRPDNVVPRGQGNHCSVEFNILYRWHATLSQDDEKWTEKVFQDYFGNVPFDQVCFHDGYATRSLLQLC